MPKDTSSKKNGLWYALSHEARVRLVTLGGLFYSQNVLAGLLETTGGTIAGFRHLHGIPMPSEKRPTWNSQFGEFTGLLERLKNAPATVEPKLEVLVNPTPPPRPLTPEEKDERDEQLLSNLIRGKWEPRKNQRPLHRLDPLAQRQIRHHAERIMDKRKGIKSLRF